MTAPDAPRLTWTSSDAASVTVEGAGFSSTAPSGSAAVCPSGGSGTVCPSPIPGSCRYRLTLRDGAGAVVLTLDAVLVIA